MRQIKGSAYTVQTKKTYRALFGFWPGRESLFWQQFSSAQYPDGLRLQRGGYRTLGFPPGRRKCRTAALPLSWGRCFQNLTHAGSEVKDTISKQIPFKNESSELNWIVLMVLLVLHLPIVVMIVPEKKKALARSHWLTKVVLLLGSTPAPTASTTSWYGTMEKRVYWLVNETVKYWYWK